MSLLGNILEVLCHRKPLGTAEQAPAPNAPDAPPHAVPTVDIEAVMDGYAHGRELDWRHSVVDMLKALDMPSSLEARRDLAAELDMAGIDVGSAAGNEAMRRELMRRVAENGGKVPPELL